MVQGRRHLSVAALLGAFSCAALACGQKGGLAANGKVFVAGYEERPGGWVAMVWKDGERLPLDERHSSVAADVVLDGDHLYAAGSVRYGAQSEAVYWKDAKAVRLSDGTRDAWAEAIAVSGGSVYVVGTDDGVATLWKDGVATPLTSGQRFASADAIAVTDAGVHVVFSEDEPVETAPGTFVMGRVARLWVDGVVHTLTDVRDTPSAWASGVAVSGGDVYVSGATWPPGPEPKGIATVWENGTPSPLTDGSQIAVADAIVVAGGDVVVGGSVFDGTSDTPAIWKNGVRLDVTHEAAARVAAIAVDGADVYGVGYHGEAATLWVNGEPSALASAYPSMAHGIAVRPR